jgi:mRNA interferase RelE/StbE
VADDPYTVALPRQLAAAWPGSPWPPQPHWFEHITGPLVGNPRRLGKPLEEPYDDVWTTRRGEYRALYTINDAEQVVTIVAVAHRRDAYRSH